MKQPEALELAELFDRGGTTNALHRAAAAELRRLHSLNQELVEALEEMVSQFDQFNLLSCEELAIKKARAALAKARGEA
jgi:hypothetical protein